jgi:hypothetical protein
MCEVCGEMADFGGETDTVNAPTQTGVVSLFADMKPV